MVEFALVLVIVTLVALLAFPPFGDIIGQYFQTVVNYLRAMY